MTDAKQTVIAKINENIAQLENALDRLKNVLLGQGYIVIVEGVALAFEIKNNVASNPTPCAPHKATRFTQRDAEALAEETFNGNKAKGRAIHVIDAIKESLEENKRIISLIIGQNDRSYTALNSNDNA